MALITEVFSASFRAIRGELSFFVKKTLLCCLILGHIGEFSCPELLSLRQDLECFFAQPYESRPKKASFLFSQ